MVGEIVLFPEVNIWVDSKGVVEVDVSKLPPRMYYMVVKASGEALTKQFAVVRQGIFLHFKMMLGRL
jgi:hypothetical protein